MTVTASAASSTTDDGSTTSDSVGAVLSIECHEKRGVVTRHVRPLIFTMQNLTTFWEHARRFPVIFNCPFDGTVDDFIKIIVPFDGQKHVANGIYMVIDDFVGVFYITNIYPEIEADAHYAFFDKQQMGRENLTKEIIKYAFNTYGFQRLNVQIPLYTSKHPHAFVQEIGFKREGRKRDAVLFNGEWFDVICYGILKSEALNG